MKNVPHPWNQSSLRISCFSSRGRSSNSSCKSPFILKRVVIAAVLSARLNLLAEQRPTVQGCLATLLHGTLGYAQNIRSLECVACTLGKV
jgi:hypothetical protein